MIEKILSVDVKVKTNKGRLKTIHLTNFVNSEHGHFKILNNDDNYRISLELDCESYSSEIRNYNDYS